MIRGMIHQERHRQDGRLWSVRHRKEQGRAGTGSKDTTWEHHGPFKVWSRENDGYPLVN